MNWKFKKDLEPQGNGDFWYDLTDGGYLKPEEILSDKKQVEKLKAAIDLVQSFERAMTDSELLAEN